MNADEAAVSKPNIRWFHLTPGRILVVLLAVEGCLLLAEPVNPWFFVPGIRSAVLIGTLIGFVLLLKRNHLGLAFGVIAAFLLVTFMGFGYSVEFRLDTGDKRFLFWGVPFSYRSTHPEISSLNDPEIPKRWVWSATQVGSNNADSMVSAFYRNAATWVEVDPQIAKLVVRDIAEYLQSTHATHCLPDCIAIIEPPIIVYENGKRHVVKDWENDPQVQLYLEKKGYAPHLRK
jgi:hypothetical protein